MGEENYGVALSIMSVIAIIASTIGTSANYSRMITSSNKSIEYTNGDYNVILLSLSAVSGIAGIMYLRYLGVSSLISTLIFVFLIIITSFRYYSDVEYRMKSDFLKYMIFYMAISAGYILGIFVYILTKEWMLALLLGEVIGVLFVFFGGTIYRTSPLKTSSAFPLVCKSMGFLLFSNLIENLTLNADRLLLMVFSGGTAVSIYYTASLLGKVVAMLSVPINSIVISYLAKYEADLSKKFWSIATVAVSALGAISFLGCAFISPFLLGILYPDLLWAAKPYIAPAILGQVFYFISGILLVILLRFRGEKKQFFFNIGYAIEFMTIVILGTYFGGLDGFVYSALIANAIRFVAVIIWGFFSSKKVEKAISQSQIQ
jgi:O-antigen/teichoic acid export membrane protein